MSKEQYIALPEEYTRRELNARYREIPLKDTTSRLLRKYFNAMANLYGIIPLHKAKEIIFSLSPKLVTEDEFLAFAEIARHECEGYYILGGDELYTDIKRTKPLDREIIDVTLINESIDLFMETKRSQQDKPYYVPDKKHLLEYDDPFYCEDTPEKLMIERQKEKYGWEFLFLGANIDAVETAKHFGIGADRAVNYHSDHEGTQLNYEVLSEAVSAVRCSVPLGTNWKKRIDEDFNSRKDGRKQ